jgi:hypothetical protein
MCCVFFRYFVVVIVQTTICVCVYECTSLSFRIGAVEGLVLFVCTQCCSLLRVQRRPAQRFGIRDAVMSSCVCMDKHFLVIEMDEHEDGKWDIPYSLRRPMRTTEGGYVTGRYSY